VLDKIAAACSRAGRDASEVQLIAVSKNHPVTLVEEVAAFGQKDFGENRIAELNDKKTGARISGIRWQLIGQLQTNKVKLLPAAILLLGPTFVAIGNAIGLDLVQLGVMMAVNLSIGLFTPPVGTTLFIAAAISREPVGKIARELWPFYLVAITVLGLISFVPGFTLY
jgi:hypothetical protein